MLILGIETSCDETAAAVVSDTKEIHSNIVLSQVAEHLPYGGVVPEIAARAHLGHIEAVIQQALREAGITFSDLDAVAATGGPGLIGGVIVGCMMGKAIASVIKKPFIAVNHLEGHALTVRLTHDVPFPYLLLLVSGGHCQFLCVEGIGRYKKLGGTVDDALGECFDKVAKMLGLGLPGGPAVEKLAQSGDERAYDFPVPMKGREGCDFSFSGLKTAVRIVVSDEWRVTSEKDSSLLATRHSPLVTPQNICASFQRAALESVCDRSCNAIKMFKAFSPLPPGEGADPALVTGEAGEGLSTGAALTRRFAPPSPGGRGNFVLAGGVAANQYVRGKLDAVAQEYNMMLIAPPVKLCTDNAAMIAWAGIERFRLGMTDGLDFEPRARWPLA